MVTKQQTKEKTQTQREIQQNSSLEVFHRRSESTASNRPVVVRNKKRSQASREVTNKEGID
jgi:hypothetical protein